MREHDPHRRHGMVFAWGLDKAGMALKQACPLARVLGACDLVRRVVDERISPVTKQSALGHVSDSQLFSHHRLHRIPKDGDDSPHHISFTHDCPPAPDKHSIASQYFCALWDADSIPILPRKTNGTSTAVTPIDSVLKQESEATCDEAEIENDFQEKCRKGAKFAAHTVFSPILGEISCLFSLALEFFTRFRGGSFQPLTHLSENQLSVASCQGPVRTIS